MTKSEIEKLDTLFSKTHPGPWENGTWPDGSVSIESRRERGYGVVVAGCADQADDIHWIAATHNAWPQIRAELDQYRAALELIGDDEMFCRTCEDGSLRFYVLCSDTFGCALADAEEITLAECPEVLAARKAGDWPAVVRWISERRKLEPIPQVKDRTHQHDAKMRSLEAENAELRAELERLRARMSELKHTGRLDLGDEKPEET